MLPGSFQKAHQFASGAVIWISVWSRYIRKLFQQAQTRPMACLMAVMNSPHFYLLLGLPSLLLPLSFLVWQALSGSLSQAFSQNLTCRFHLALSSLKPAPALAINLFGETEEHAVLTAFAHHLTEQAPLSLTSLSPNKAGPCFSPPSWSRSPNLPLL